MPTSIDRLSSWTPLGSACGGPPYPNFQAALYNAAVAFHSVGAKQDLEVNHHGPQNWVYRIQGLRISPLEQIIHIQRLHWSKHIIRIKLTLHLQSTMKDRTLNPVGESLFLLVIRVLQVGVVTLDGRKLDVLSKGKRSRS